MPLADRDYMKKDHPPACTCVDCERRRARKGKTVKKLCPKCKSSKIYYNPHFQSWKCVKCEHSFTLEGGRSLWDRTIGRLLSWIR
jgi:hypothetical protein